MTPTTISLARRRFLRPSKNTRSGGALVVSLIAVAVVAALAVSYLQFAAAVSQRQASGIDRKQAFYLAESGLAEAFAGMVIGKTGNVGTAEAPAAFGGGLFWVEVTDLGDEMWELRSTGMYGSGRALLSLVVEKGEIGVGTLGVFGKQDIVIPPGSVIDGYESRKSTYSAHKAKVDAERLQVEVLGVGVGVGIEAGPGPMMLAPSPSPAPAVTGEYEPEPTSSGLLGSNGDIYVSGTEANPTVITGSLMPGSTNSVIVTGEVDIEGSTTPRETQVSLPPPDVPSVPMEPPLTHVDPVPLLLTGEELGYECLRVGRNSEVILEGPTGLVVEKLILDPGASLTFDTTLGSVHVYATEEVTLSPTSMLATTEESTGIATLQVDGAPTEPVRLEGQGSFHGIVYAPEAEVVVGSSFEVFGALIGDRIEFSGPARLHFDQSLSAASVEAGLPSLFSWRIVELESELKGVAKNDPFVILGVDPASCPDPKDAHEDQFLEIEYVNGVGTTVTFSGMESAFDWDQVDDLVSGSRDGEPILYWSVKGFVDRNDLAGDSSQFDMPFNLNQN